MLSQTKNSSLIFRYFETRDGERTERREIKWNVGAYWNYDPNEIPSEWRMWLRKLRDNAPTDEELAMCAA